MEIEQSGETKSAVAKLTETPGLLVRGQPSSITPIVSTRGLILWSVSGSDSYCRKWWYIAVWAKDPDGACETAWDSPGMPPFVRKSSLRASYCDPGIDPFYRDAITSGWLRRVETQIN